MAEPLLLVLLLPEPLEDLPDRARAEALLVGPAAVAVEPARVSFGALGRLPEFLGTLAASMQAKRMRLRGAPRLVVLLDPLQYPLARALLMRHPGAELVYAPDGSAGRHRRAGEWHELARQRAVAVLDRAGAWDDEVAGRAGAAGIGVSLRPSAGAG